MSVLIFFDLKAIIIAFVILAAGIVFYIRGYTFAARLAAIGGLTQTVTLAFGIAYLVRTLNALGLRLAVALLTPLYGALINLDIQVFLCVKYTGAHAGVME